MSRRKKRCPYVIKSTGEQCNHDRDHQGDWCHTEAGARFRRGYLPPKERKAIPPIPENAKIVTAVLGKRIVTSSDIDNRGAKDAESGVDADALLTCTACGEPSCVDPQCGLDERTPAGGVGFTDA